MSEHRPIDLSNERLVLGNETADRVARVAGSVGVLGLLAAGILGFATGAEDGPHRFYLGYLVSFCFFLSVTLGALFFVLIQHLTKAGWSVVVRRIAEGFASNAGLMALLFLPLIFGLNELFAWMRPEVLAESDLIRGKTGYLNRTFFFVRLAIYFVSWFAISRYFFAKSIAQDESGDPELTSRMERWSAPLMIVFAITLTFAAFDLLMSLEPTWFSTIFGVYYFAGSALVLMATLVITLFLLQRSGRLIGIISTEHYHDLGKLMFAFIVFWAYIAFSQYMLIWYANIPEETEWFLRRQTGQWTALSWFQLIGHFIVPFLAVISRVPKRSKVPLFAAAIWMLIVHYWDLYYLAIPHSSEGVIPFGLVDVACFLGIGGLYVAAFMTRMRNHALIPKNDPRLGESLAFENY